MATTWTDEQIYQLDTAHELEITTRHADGTLRTWVPIWVVCLDAAVYVRTWYRRDTGWFGHAITARQADIRLPDLRVNVAITDLRGYTDEIASTLNEAVSLAYSVKYGRDSGARRMVSPDATATTLRLEPVPTGPGTRS